MNAGNVCIRGLVPQRSRNMRIDLRWARGETFTNTTGIASRGYLVVFQLPEPNSSGLKIARVLGLTVPLAIFALPTKVIECPFFVQVGRSTPAQSTVAP